jgi:antitoxin ParD1/3/4
VVQHGLDLLREQAADAEADRVALRTLLTERAAGHFVTADTLRETLARRRAARRE